MTNTVECPDCGWSLYPRTREQCRRCNQTGVVPESERDVVIEILGRIADDLDGDEEKAMHAARALDWIKATTDRTPPDRGAQ